MTTDSDRREVARGLRELANGYEEVSDFDLARTLGLGAVSRYGYDPDDVRRLADLIEPPARCPHYMHPCCRTDAGGDYIDRDALLALAADMDLYARTAPYPSFGRRVATYARRIREALGVSNNA